MAKRWGTKIILKCLRKSLAHLQAVGERELLITMLLPLLQLTPKLYFINKKMLFLQAYFYDAEESTEMRVYFRFFFSKGQDQISTALAWEPPTVSSRATPASRLARDLGQGASPLGASVSSSVTQG